MSSKAIAITYAAVTAQKKAGKLELAKALRSDAEGALTRVNRFQGVEQDAHAAPTFLQNFDGEWIAGTLNGQADRWVFIPT